MGSKGWLTWWLSRTKFPTQVHKKGQGDLGQALFCPEDRFPRESNLPLMSSVTVCMRPVWCGAPQMAGDTAWEAKLGRLRAPDSLRPPSPEATSRMWDKLGAAQGRGEEGPVGDC